MRYYLIILFLFISVAINGQQRTYKLPANVNTGQYDPSVLILKLKPGSSPSSRGQNNVQSVKKFIEKSGLVINDIVPAIPHQGKNSSTARNSGKYSLSNIYKVQLASGENVIDVINDLLKHDEVLYAEPYFNYRPLYAPSDPESDKNNGKQNYLNVIKAFDAWTIEQGDTSVVIGILDTGVDLDHMDLTDNIKYNYDDPINGVDDDDDGLIDNFSGWDMANNDNIPESDTDIHGNLVSGIAAASTNNNEGIAGTGFKSKFLPIKIFKSGTNAIYGGYEAIALAADLGCKVINLSWGGAGTFSQFGQDVINYAVLERDVAIVAAAGNTNKELDFYPASMDNVISVGSTTLDDEKTAWATYSHHIDIMAPGNAIYSTGANNGYTYAQGTSLSSPMVAGTLALVRARFPSLNARQAMEKVRVTADDIYNIPMNKSYRGMLGKGRLNMLKALTQVSPAIRMTNIDFNNGLGHYIFYEDTLSIVVDFKNFLDTSASSTSAILSCDSEYATVMDSVFTIGSLPTLSSISNENNPYTVVLSKDFPPNEKLIFRIDFKGGAYNDFQYFELTGSPEYMDIQSGETTLTFSSNGNLGYNENGFISGTGVTYKGKKVLDNIGLAIASGSTTVIDNFPNYLPTNTRDQDFITKKNIKLYKNSTADYDVRNTFISTEGLKVDIEQKTLTWLETDFIVLEYRVINPTDTDMPDLHVGLFTDWNLNNRNFNSAGWNNETLLGYVKDNSDEPLYAGVAILKGEDPLYTAIDNKNFNGNTADIPTYITDEIKYNLLSKGISQSSAGNINNGNDVSQITGATIRNLGANEARKVTLVLTVGGSLEKVQQDVSLAKQKYNEYVNKPPVLYIVSVCPGSTAVIDPPGDIFEFYEDPMLTNLISTGESISTMPITAPQTYYAVNKDNTYAGDVYRVMAMPNPADADFLINPDPLLLDETGNTKASFHPVSKEAISWQWDFGNGFYSNTVDPDMNYTQPGSYDVSLTLKNKLGCVATVTKTLTVANRSNRPDIANQKICKNEDLTLAATNATNLNVYTDKSLSELVYSGTAFNTSDITSDTTFYVTSTDSTYDSNPKEVFIQTSKVEASFAYALDTLNLAQKKLLNFYNNSKNEELYYWYINDVFQGANKEIKFDYSNETSFTATLVTEDIDGCFDSKKWVIEPNLSNPPVCEDVHICAGESANIMPQKGNIFYFYSDPELQNLQYKGSSISLNHLSRDTVLYVTGIDNLLESDPETVSVQVGSPKADFTAQADNTNIVIQNSSTETLTFLWLLNSDTVSILEEPQIPITAKGDYSLELQVTDAQGCKDNITQNVKVDLDLTVSGINETLVSDVQIYPNPATGRLFFTTPAAIAEVYTQNGEKIRVKTPDKDYIDVSVVPAGAYIIKIFNQGRVVYRKLIKK